MILLVILFLLAFFIYYCVLHPYLKFRKYKKYGPGYFYPIVGEIVTQMHSLEKYSDIGYVYQHLQDESEGKLKVFVENLGNSVLNIQYCLRFLYQQLGNSVKIQLLDPELLKELYQQISNDCYVDSMFYVQNFERLFGKGLIFAVGEQWKTIRHMLSPAFHFEYIQNLSPQIESITDSIFKSYIDQNKLSKVDVIAMMSEITAQTIIFSFFGNRMTHVKFQGESLACCISYILKKIAYQSYELSYLLFGARFLQFGLFKEHRQVEKYLQEFKKQLKDIINQSVIQLTQEYKEKGSLEQNCILSQLIKDGNIQKITEQELMDNFMTLFIAGTDTTSHLVGMAIYYLTQYTDIADELKKEVDSNQNNTPQGLLNLPLLNAVLKETLRYYGPANGIFDRLAIKDNNLGHVKIEKGTIVTVSALSIHKNPLFYKDPHSYRPHRWINGETKNLPMFTFIPFSGGKRNCIGQHLALIEARIMLTKFIKLFEFSSEKDYKLKLNQGLVTQPNDPLQINLKVRQSK